MGAHSFLDVVASINGPGGSFSLSEGGIADEGITTAMTGEKNTMVTGARGEGMHSLHASKSGRITVRVLKNGRVNALLSDLYSYQTVSAATHGQNTITIRNPTTGDTTTATECAFVKFPDKVDAKEGGIMEWAFDCIAIDTRLGNGRPSATN